MDKLTNAIKQAFDTNELPEGVKQQKLSALLSPSKQTGRDGITMKRSRRFNKKLAGVIAAAATAAALTVTAGAAIYSSYRNKHTESVEHYLKGGDSLAEFEPIEVSDKNTELSIDKVLSDGKMATVIVSVKAYNDEGKFFAENLQCTATYTDQEFDENSSLFSFGRQFNGESKDPMKGISYRLYFRIGDVDLSKPVRLWFYGSNWDTNETTAPEFSEDLSLEANVETAEFYNDKGHSVTLSPYELYEDLGDLINRYKEDFNAQLVKNDGTVVDDPELLGNSDITYDGNDPAECYRYISFPKTIDIDDYKAIIIDGEEYFRK